MKVELLIASFTLLALSLVASIAYYRLIKRARQEYEGASGLVREITLGFGRQVSRLAGQVERTNLRTEEAQRDSKRAVEGSEEALKAALAAHEEAQILENKIEEAERGIQSVKVEVQKLASGLRGAVPGRSIPGPLPLSQEVILEGLTETEVLVLSIIDELGDAAVPDIKDRIQKTREHTARLLKKLFEGGFIDRNTSGMPYRYVVRREIRELVRQVKGRTKAAT